MPRPVLRVLSGWIVMMMVVLFVVVCWLDAMFDNALRLGPTLLYLDF